MTMNLNCIAHSRESTEQFLFYKTQMDRPDQRVQTEPFGIHEKLLRAFPHAKTGNAFIEQSLERLATVFTFSAMVVKLDDLADPDTTDAAHPPLLDAAKSIDFCCRGANGLWGLVQNGRFGCFFPDMHVKDCPAVARNIQRNLSMARQHTVSIGIAGYPTVNYHKHQILENAQKALAHAAFFGPQSIVCFDSVSLNISGDAYYADGDVLTAIEEFKRALMIDPSNVNVHNSLGVCYGVMGELAKALDAFETAVWLNSHEYMAVYNIGMVKLLNGEKQIALDHFLKASEMNPDVFEIAFQAGKLLHEMGHPEKAKPYLDTAVRLQPDSAAAFRYLGDCFAAADDIEKAVSAYKTAVKLNPNDAAALSALGHMFDRCGENPEISTTFCLQSVRISPENGLYRYRLATLYLKQNRYAEALKEFQAATERGHNSHRFIEEIQNRNATAAVE